ncbi:UDP-N-acetylmuramoyl-L-alanine--D-glutamate ligase [Campylobacter insulaenigrae]|uniref:UDP-N-acetylmuramoyl-L-alanine--D-glutamate ligase n=1 Tax=Campylobacter insulaenigrae TaxID=260714 RepID=UPI000F6BD09B|nr:UDP-N-acetylmuramoyl-L-alanine--D-glutamate ligase [Campylobacter insulaenigrae]MCR6572674.1 UDP-N-acetylmuramoyl-L-alanine--D-glutamate ligase [Campylobacter insulaenigrae]MCR6591275.1 UDP-N-acetylmuramoyl-L-alanine--D-glutamate ligase [Campylobacter insulaenigrae]MCR6592829.1 UDP-N-acetylmuramoyl-L-alanine--D-glutamate ligase [Campylobacter insulaenigrae]VEJ52623.1 UDP-N-acetylmuramoyl-L-alanyl-D-glutamate synthetase [Campylobacter insulaenigrae]
MKISLFGYGKTTKAFAQRFANCDIYDDNFKDISKDEFNNTFLPPHEFDPNKSTLEIPSPGFPNDHFLIKNAKNLISEYDFFYDAMPKSVWISGTNGKTTTTQMTHHLLKHINAQMGANIGIPLANLDTNANLWILESSSFSLFYTKVAKPEIYALLPISPDHLSWHNNFKEYEEAKLKVLKRMNENDVAILPKKYETYPCAAHIISYFDEYELAHKMEIDIEKINFKTPFLLDAIMALSIEKIILDRCSYDLLNEFKIEKDKLEELNDHKNRLWVNDTKATNLDASLAALKRYKEKSIHLIIGGDDKGVDLSDLFNFMKTLNIKLYAIGSNTDKILTLAKKANIQAYSCKFLDVAVNKINENLKIGEIALLSPACASLDQFKSYQERGEKFKKYIANLT